MECKYIKFTNEICSKQKWEEEEFDFEPDSSPVAWDHFKTYYKDVCFSEKVQIKHSRLTSNAFVNGIAYEIAGDCSFNFNCKKVCSLKSIINDDLDISDDDKKQLNELLEKCNEKHHTLLNFDLMPVTGGMNTIKGNLKYKAEKILIHDVGRVPNNGLLDRLDTFICFLDESYKSLDSFIKSKNMDLRAIGEFFSNSVFTISMKSENFTILYDLLKEYGDIYEYCKSFYTIHDSKFVEKLIENGKKPMKTAKDVENYMNLANEFWKEKEKNFRILKWRDLKCYESTE